MSEGDHKVSKISSEAIFAERPISSSKFLVSLILCLSLIMVDLKFDTSNAFRGYLQDIFSPFYNLVEVPLVLIESFSGFVTSKQELRETIKEYQEDNNKLQVINSQLVEITRRNSELDLVWNSAQIKKEAYLLGQKMSLSANSLKPRMLLSIKNNNSVIKINQAVMSSGGIMGKITSVGRKSAEVMMVHDPRSMIPIISSTTRIHAVLQGKGLERFGKLINIKKTAKLKEGEDLYSSGLGGVFPPNFFVGKIISIQDNVDDEFLEVRVEFLGIPEEQDFFLIFTG